MVCRMWHCYKSDIIRTGTCSPSSDTRRLAPPWQAILEKLNGQFCLWIFSSTLHFDNVRESSDTNKDLFLDIQINFSALTSLLAVLKYISVLLCSKQLSSVPCKHTPSPSDVSGLEESCHAPSHPSQKSILHCDFVHLPSSQLINHLVNSNS